MAATSEHGSTYFLKEAAVRGERALRFRAGRGGPAGGVDGVGRYGRGHEGMMRSSVHHIMCCNENRIIPSWTQRKSYYPTPSSLPVGPPSPHRCTCSSNCLVCCHSQETGCSVLACGGQFYSTRNLRIRPVGGYLLSGNFARDSNISVI